MITVHGPRAWDERGSAWNGAPLRQAPSGTHAAGESRSIETDFVQKGSRGLPRPRSPSQARDEEVEVLVGAWVRRSAAGPMQHKALPIQSACSGEIGATKKETTRLLPKPPTPLPQSEGQDGKSWQGGRRAKRAPVEQLGREVLSSRPRPSDTATHHVASRSSYNTGLTEQRSPTRTLCGNASWPTEKKTLE